jgi:hypothetical protein
MSTDGAGSLEGFGAEELADMLGDRDVWRKPDREPSGQ